MTNHLIHSVHQILSLQPVDVAHIYVPDLHEARQEKKKKIPTVTKVINCHKTLLRLSSALTLPLQVMSRLTSWETWPGGLKGGTGEDDRGSQKEGKKKTCKAELSSTNLHEAEEILNLSDIQKESNEENESIGAQVRADRLGDEEAETLAGQFTGVVTSAAGNMDNKSENPKLDEEGKVDDVGKNLKLKNGVEKGRPTRKAKKVYDPPSDEDDISGDDSFDDPLWGEKDKYYLPAKGGNKTKGATTETPPSVFKRRREEELEEEWRAVGGHTPEEGKQKYGTFNLKVFELLVHHQAKVEKIDLSKTRLTEQFFKNLVSTHGSVPGGSRVAPYTSHFYLKKVWRKNYCTVECPPGKRKVYGTHLYEPPQEEMTPCRRCTVPTEIDQMNDHIMQKLTEKCSSTGQGDTVSISAEEQQQAGSNSSSDRQATDEKTKEPKDGQCPHCSKTVGNLRRHIRENCRLAGYNKEECPSCKMMVGKYRLKEHMHGRIDKTGKTVILGCLEKTKREDDKVGKLVCKVCGLSVINLKRHMSDMHQKRGVATSQKMKATQEVQAAQVVKATGSCSMKSGCSSKQEKKDPDQKTQSQRDQRIKYTRAEFNKACEEAMYNIVVNVSLQQGEGDLSQGGMIRNALQYLEACGIHLLPPTILIPLDGNCLFCSLVHLQDPTLGGLGLDDAATQLRRASVTQTLAALDSLDEQDMQHLQNAAATDEANRYLTRDELGAALLDYMKRGVYQGGLGDMLPQMCSYYLRRPILIVDFNTKTKSTSAYFINPSDIFNAEAESFVPYVLVRQGEHFVPLLVPEEAGEMLAADFLFSIQKRPTAPEEACRQAPASKLNRDRSPSPDGSQDPKRIRCDPNSTFQDLQPTTGGSRDRGSRGEGSRGEGSRDGGSRDEGSTNSEKQLDAPDPTVGERKRLLSELNRMPLQFSDRIRDLLKKLDTVLIESPLTEEEMKRLSCEVEEVLEVMRRWCNKELKWRTNIEELIGGPKDASTAESYFKCVARKIVPFLRGYFLDRSPGFKVTNIVAFGKPEFVRINEEIVEECNATVGETAATKRIIMASWIALCKSLAYAVKRSIDTIGSDAVKDIREWYTELANELTAALNRLNKFYAKVRTENADMKKAKGMPLDKAIKKWLQSDVRTNLNDDLLALAQQVKSGNVDVNVSAKDFRRFREFVLTELCIYFPVRIGAWFHFTVRYSFITYEAQF